MNTVTHVSGIREHVCTDDDAPLGVLWSALAPFCDAYAELPLVLFWSIYMPWLLMCLVWQDPVNPGGISFAHAKFTGIKSSDTGRFLTPKVASVTLHAHNFASTSFSEARSRSFMSFKFWHPLSPARSRFGCQLTELGQVSWLDIYLQTKGFFPLTRRLQGHLRPILKPPFQLLDG